MGNSEELTVRLAELIWRKAKKSGDNGGDCVEMSVLDAPGDLVPHKAGHPRLVVLRDSKDPQGPTLFFTDEEWEALKDGVKNNEFDF
jgi:hypothetical protein